MTHKLYEIGIDKVCPTDCTIYLLGEHGKKKVFLVDSNTWKQLSEIILICRDIMNENRREDECRRKD